MIGLVASDDGESITLLGTEEVRRYSHFEIMLAADGSLNELGHGAMGTTYWALDTVLQSPVALKVIGRNVADSPAVRARFLREARAAARLRHPNVASVFHYGEQQGECFYVMEMVEGETLEARVRRGGPLPALFAMELIGQVAGALAAAEACGIVHRDLKPSNLMLSANRQGYTGATPIVKVIDFGLAKVVATGGDDPGLGDTRGGFVGTPAFASPEQFACGENERIDTRSDIYSLGVTLWYLLCGKLPFVGKTLTEVHEQQTRQPLPLEQLRAARVPGPVVALLRSLLAVTPAARPQSARELLEVLHRCQRQLLRASRNWYARLAGILGLLALSVLGAALWREHTRPPAPLQDRSIAVLPFQNMSADADAFYTTGVQDEITADLARLPELTVTSPGSTKEYPPGRRNLATIGGELGVTHLLEGSCRRDGQQVHITLRLTDLHASAHLWTRQYDRQLAEIFAVQGEIARDVADQLHVSLSIAEKASMNRPPTRDLAAYELYLRSHESPPMLPDETAIRHDAVRCIALLDQAVARDPNFMLAYCDLAIQHDYAWTHSNGATPEELSVDHRTLAEVALQKARILQPDAGEMHLATARHLLFCGDTSGQAAIEAELARRALPNNAGAEHIVAEIACEAGRWDDAVRSYEHAIVLAPRDALCHTELAETFAAMRRYEDFDRVMAAAIPLVPAEDRTELRLARAMGPVEARADLGPLRMALASVAGADDPSNARGQRNLLLKICERDPEGIERVLAADDEIAVAGFPYPKAWFRALAAKMRGDEAGAHMALAAARPVMEQFVAAKPQSGVRLSLLAVIDAGLGRKEDAVREAQRACEMQPYGQGSTQAPTIFCNQAVVYAWIGQPDLAFQTLNEAVNHPAAGGDLINQPTYGDFRLDPIWDALRDDPRFEALVQRLAPDQKR